MFVYAQILPTKTIGLVELLATIYMEMRILTYILIFISLISCDKTRRETISKFQDGSIEVERIYPKPGLKNEYKYVEYYRNGKVRFEGYVKNGYYRGTKKNYYENGKPMEFCELKDSGKFNYCCPDGFYKLFYTNGYLEQTHYKIDTRIEGKITNYDTAGFKVNELIVENNIKNGIAKYFYSSGKVRSIEFYRNDTLIDIVIDFFESGDTAFKATILNGKINFPIKKCNKKGNCIIGRYTDDSHEKVEWTWRNPNNETTRKEILEPSDSGFVIPEI